MKVSIIYLLLMCLGISSNLHSQNLTGERRQNLSKRPLFCEGGMSIYRLDDTDNLNNSSTSFKQKLKSNFFSGVNFKCILYRNVFRFSFDYNQQDVYATDFEGYKRTGCIRSTNVSTGYACLLRKARFSPYVFSDLVYGYTWEKGMESGYYWFTRPSNQPYEIVTQTITGCAGLGLRYNPFRSLVLNLEGNFAYYFSFQENRIGKHTVGRRNGLLLNPLQVSLAFII
jgi:hypothetical protein